MKAQTNRRQVPFADGTGMTARAGTALLAQTADWIGLTEALSEQIGDCRDWEVHDPGKVAREIVVMLADGGDALRHMNALDNQQALFGEIASPSAANRTIVALADDELVVEKLADARWAMWEQIWAAGGAPPVVTTALTLRSQRDGGDDGDGDTRGCAWAGGSEPASSRRSISMPRRRSWRACGTSSRPSAPGRPPNAANGISRQPKRFGSGFARRRRSIARPARRVSTQRSPKRWTGPASGSGTRRRIT